MAIVHRRRTERGARSTMRVTLASLLAVVAAVGTTASARAEVPVRISIKFIVDTNGNRPATGALNTDAEITTDRDWGNTILRMNHMEFQLETVDFGDLAGVSSYYTADANSTERDNLRTAAMANPTRFRWRSDAINIYITAGTGSAISRFPPGNDIILMNQGCGNTPSCMLHELGHSLNLEHTHTNDGCTDTIQDDSSWTRDDIALHNFSNAYADLTASQKTLVDRVWNDVMSYHTSEPQLVITECQRDIVSLQAHYDRAWLLAKLPIYVRSGATGAASGTYLSPYGSFQSALNAGGLAGKVLVLDPGTYTITQAALADDVEIIARTAASVIDKGVQLYRLPVDMEDSNTPEVRRAIRAAKEEDKAARRANEDAKTAAARTTNPEERARVLRGGEESAAAHRELSKGHLEQAAAHAQGDEKLAIQLELAERARDAGDCAQAITWFRMVARDTDQPGLRDRALREVAACEAKQ